MLRIVQAVSADLPELLKLQYEAYQSEALLYNDFAIQPLTQTLDELEKEFERMTFYKALKNGHIVGSVRVLEESGTLHIGKLIVNPRNQNQGIGKQIMNDLEERYRDASRLELFTGHKSVRNLHFYGKLGYTPFRETIIHDDLTLIYMRKIRG